jgi:D-arabinose 1-dehydrogenase-like Zn-dependent alcohol dehydrogenase
VRAVVAPRLGGPWEVREVPDPSPGPGEVVLAVEASGICYSDVHALRNPAYGCVFPRVPGHEVVGRVGELGPGVERLAAGDRVGVAWAQRWCGRCRPCHDGWYAFCEQGSAATGVTVDGGHAELVAVDARSVERVPEEIPAAEAAPLLCAGYTVYTALRRAEVRPGERVAVVGIGGLGHLALQYARGLGAEVVAVTRSPGKRELLASLGAHEVVVAEGGAGAALRERGGADVIVAAGNSLDPDILAGLRTGGRLSLAGVSESPLTTTPLELVFRNATVLGASPGPRRLLRDLFALHLATGARALVETFPLERAPEALARVESGEVRFKAVLVPGR